MLLIIIAGIAIIWLLLINAVGNYGKDTILGYWGSVLLAIFTTPLTAFIEYLSVVKSVLTETLKRGDSISAIP